MITAMVQALSEAFVFADAQGIDPKIFLETVNSALFQSPFYAAYGKVMLEPPEHPGATVMVYTPPERNMAVVWVFDTD